MSAPVLVATYVEMIPPRVRGALYFSGFVLPMIAGYLALRGWAGSPELWLAGTWSSLTNAIAGAQVVAGNVAKRRRVPPPRGEDGSTRVTDLIVLAVVLVIVGLSLAAFGVFS